MAKANWSKENLEKIVKESYSIAEVLRKLGLVSAGGGYAQAKKYIDKYQLDTSHFTGQAWRDSPNISESKKEGIPLEEVLQESTNFKSHWLKERLIKAGLKLDKCECCGITEWNQKPITLELHHINGNHYDNRFENLQILCPNCHSQTDNFRNRNKGRSVDTPEVLSKKRSVKEKICPICNNTFKPQKSTQKYCSIECVSIARNKGEKSTKWTKEFLTEHISQFSTIQDAADALNVSRTTLRKYLDEFNLLDDFKAKFDFRGKAVLQLDVNGNLIKEWPSVSDAENTLNLNGVGKCARFQRKSCGGYIWRFKSDN